MSLRRFVMDTRPLRIPAFRRLWVSSIATAIGGQLGAVAVPFQAYEITGSSAYVGIAGFIGLAPMVIGALWGGAVADAVDRRKLLFVTNTGIALSAIVFWVQAALQLNNIWVLFVVLAAQQLFFGANMPARTAVIPRLVPAKELPAANALGSTIGQLGGVIGPLLAGALIPLLGLQLLYLLDAVAVTAVLWAVWRLPALPPTGESRSAGIREILEGFRYLGSNRILWLSYLADVIAMVLGMPRALFPQLATETFGDPTGGGFALGVLYAAIPAGAILGGLFSGSYTRIRRHGMAIVVGVCVWGVAMIGLGLSGGNLILAVFFMMLGGAADFVSMVFRATILQAAVTDEMRGRLQGSFTVVVAGGPRLADLLHGAGGAFVGTTIAISGGGALVVLATVALALLFPVFWRYRPSPLDDPVEPGGADTAGSGSTDEPGDSGSEERDTTR